ncbi:DUF4307 domain-containing protein [Phytoactinopolyspora mesophila]|uniref:DUF4307 domain-containing protein n=1 Tax=Phytoactinopolyspora mesophila TaxID=2650750 RepID=A0A7K3M915_9ACTN|nr:DUF4307 domain-containing protein [Phytoactinopolyspora mesophila]NDL59826.1 DUF4307 domain-containing protein [Phytoactinopolyspora mesophila]
MSNPGTPEPQPTAQPQADADERLQQRYGRGSSHLGQRAGNPGISRRNIIIVVFIAAIAAVATWFIIDAQRGSIQAALRSWESPADGVMPVIVEVDRSPDTVLTCELIAVDIRHIVVGQLEFEIPAGEPARQLVEADIPLRGDAIAPELLGCSRDG